MGTWGSLDAGILTQATIAAEEATIAAEEAKEVAKHFHGYERWMCAATTPVGTTHVADAISDTSHVAFHADAGDEVYGEWVQVLGADDTPVFGEAMTKFDAHRIEITNAERKSTVHLLQIAFGATAEIAEAADDYSTVVFASSATGSHAAPVNVMQKRNLVGQNAWVRVFIPSQNTGTVDFYLGVHEYED